MVKKNNFNGYKEEKDKNKQREKQYKQKEYEIIEEYEQKITTYEIQKKEEDDVSKKIRDALAKAKKESLKDEFKKLATEKSIDPSAKENGGDLGSVRKGIFVQEFEDAAFALKDGEISKEPVKTQFGYHVIYKQGSKKAEKMPFDGLKERIKEGLKGQKFKETLDKKADDLFEKAKVEYKMPLPAPKADEKAAPAKK